MFSSNQKKTVMTTKQYDFIVNVSESVQRFGFLSPIADWIGCQFALESSFGNSRIAKVKNNYCGMKVPRLRPTLNINSGSGFASYDSLDDCIVDYVLLLSYNHFNYQQLVNLDCFLARLATIRYCDDDGYIDAINNIYKQFKSYKK